MSTQYFHRSRGQAIMALGMVISFVLLMMLGLFSFETSRVELAREQLRSASDAAALAAAATLASSDNLDPTAAHTTAINTALTAFQQNTVIGSSLSSANLAYSSTEQPAPKQALLFLEFLDPHNNNQPVPIGDPNGKIVRITASFGVLPTFGALLGLGGVPIQSVSYGGVPSLDVALCFDVSASIDDQTPVTFVRREWSGGKSIYVIPPTVAGAPAGPLAQGHIFDIIGPPAVGSSIDGIAPQNLSDSNSPNKNQYPLNFSENSGYPGADPGLRGATNTGSPPGAAPVGVKYLYTYTDLVVNIDGNNVFAGITSNGFNFPDVATLVEASRGNLENANVFAASKANTGVPANVTPKAGYQAEYQRLAKLNIHPLGDAQLASQDFLSIMNTNTDAHFSLVAFTSNAGTSSTSTYSGWNVDASYPSANWQNFPVPLIALNPANLATNYDTIYNELPLTVATSGTNIGDAVLQAVNQLTTKSRQGSKKAIVLFTDGEPTVGGPLNNDPWTNARQAAGKAKAAGIPIYSIGLAQNQAIIPSETAILTDANSDPVNGGVSGIAGNGGKFFLVTKVEDLRLTFENIARQLVQLVK